MQSYTVRKPFRFAGKSYERGGKFVPGRVACPARKVRQLVDQRILINPLDELTLAEPVYHEVAPVTMGPEPLAVEEVSVEEEITVPDTVNAALEVDVVKETLPKYQGKQADAVADALILSLEAGNPLDEIEYARLPKRCQKRVDAVR